MTSAGTPGASLRMWRDFFPGAYIYGGDVDPTALINEDRIRCAQVDQTDAISIRSFWDTVRPVGGFDLIVDDGLHTLGAAKVLLENSFSELRVGGIYTIEDISPFALPDYLEWLNATELTYRVFCLFKGNRSVSDDVLVAIIRAS